MTAHSEKLLEISGVKHGFERPEGVEPITINKGIYPNQKHTNRIDVLSAQSAKPSAVSDGLYTAMPNQAISVVTADCLPLLIGNKQGTDIAAVHAGWRGLADGIVSRAIALFTARRLARDDLIVAIGPSIRSCCYEVGEDFRTNLMDCSLSPSLYSNCFEVRSESTEKTRRYFSLQALCKNMLLSEGLSASQIDDLNICTYCSGEGYGSYRRRTHYAEEKTMQFSWIALNG